jgi:hypothetical protein
MATTQAVIDTFVAISVLTTVALLIAVAHKPAPLGPASARSLFRSRNAAPRDSAGQDAVAP